MSTQKDAIVGLVDSWVGNHWTDPVTDSRLRITNVFSQDYPSGPVEWIVCVHLSVTAGDNSPVQLAIKKMRDSSIIDVVSEPRRCHRRGIRLSPPDEVRNMAMRFREKAELKIRSVIGG